MGKTGSFALAALMAAILVGATALGLAKGGLYPVWQEGDMLHMVQIVAHEAAGEWPHLDFMTPLGVLAFAPVTLFVRLGHGFAESFVLGQALVGAVLLPAAWWAGASRLGRGWAHLFGAGIMVLAVALVPATPDPDLSLSMTYNRWSWALSFVVLVLAILPPRGQGRGVRLADGTVLGLGLAALALLKVTYAVACAPVVALALLLRRDGAGLSAAALAGLTVMAVPTLMAGPAFWSAYLGDLLAVTATDVRAFPGEPLLDVIAGTASRFGTALFLAAVILARRVGRGREGVLLLAAGPGLAYVTYQNFGNDPVWLFLLGIVAVALRPAPGERPGLREGLTVTGWAALALVAPIFMAMAESPVRNFAASPAGTVAVLPGDQGLFMPRDRVEHVQTRVSRPLDGGRVWWADEGLPEPALVAGQPLEPCRLLNGLAGWFRGVSDDIEAAGLGGRRAIVADMLNAYWLYGGVERLPGGAPWYYGGLPGVEAAEVLLVPQCATRPDVRARVLREVEAAGYELTELRRTRDYILLELVGSSSAPASAR